MGLAIISVTSMFTKAASPPLSFKSSLLLSLGRSGLSDLCRVTVTFRGVWMLKVFKVRGWCVRSRARGDRKGRILSVDMGPLSRDLRASLEAVFEHVGAHALLQADT